MRRLTIPLLLAYAMPAGAITPMSPLLCTTTTATNRSTGEPTGLEGSAVVFQPSALVREDAYFTARRTVRDPHGHDIFAYRIDRAGLAFTGTVMRKRDDIGEEHLIAFAGRCVHKVP